VLPHEAEHAATQLLKGTAPLCAATAEKTGLPVENTHGNWQTHMTEIADHAALRIGGSFGVLLMRAIAASSRTPPQIRDISALTSALKPVRRKSMTSTTPMLEIQLLKSHAENMTAPPLGLGR